MMELYLHSPICLHDTVLNLLSTRQLYLSYSTTCNVDSAAYKNNLLGEKGSKAVASPKLFCCVQWRANCAC
jgi:hypothetical protein